MQVKYLDRTPKPFYTNLRYWFIIIETVNNHMPYIYIDKEKLNKYYPVKIMLENNITQFWAS